MDSDLQHNGGTVYKIVFVDDEAESREIDQFLSDIGRQFDVVNITNGRSLFEYLHKTDESLFPNVIVLDRISGEMNALDILQQLKKNAELAKIPVIIHSCILSDRLKTELLEDGAEEMRQTKSVLDALKQLLSRQNNN